MSARTVVTPKRPSAESSLTWLVVVLLLVGVLSVERASATDAPALRPMDPLTGRLLSDYLANPRANRAAVLALAQQGIDTLPLPAQLAIADAHLRAGSTARAAAILTRVANSGIAGPWSGWAEYGLGWVALSTGDSVAAVTHFGRAQAAGWNPAAVTTMVGLAEAGAGIGIPATQTLAAVAADGSASSALLQAAQIGTAYAYYWSGEFAEARTRFALFAREYPSSPLADDASYAAAWSAFRAGQREDALRELHALASADRAGRRARVVSDNQVNLAGREVLGNGLRRYRRARQTMQAVDGQIVDILDLDGVALARAALRRIGDAEPARGAVESWQQTESATAGTAGYAAVAANDGHRGKKDALGNANVVDSGATSRSGEPSVSRVNTEDDARSSRRFVPLFLLAIVAVAIAWLWRRPQAGEGVDALRAERGVNKQTLRRS